MSETQKIGLGKKIGIGCGGFVGLFLLLIIIVAIFSSKNTYPGSTSKTNTTNIPAMSELQSKILEDFNKVFTTRKRQKKCDITIEFKEMKNNDFVMNLVFSNVQPISNVADDTNTLVRATLANIMASGRKPADEHISVMVWGHTPVKGETGAERVLVYGYSRYNYNSDSVEFSPSKD